MAASLVGAAFTVAPARRVGRARVSRTRASAIRASARDEASSADAAPAVTRRQALSAVTAGVASLAAASPAFAGLLDGLELPSPAACDVKAKRVINLPKL